MFDASQFDFIWLPRLQFCPNRLPIFGAESYDPWDQKNRKGQVSILPLDSAESRFSAKIGQKKFKFFLVPFFTTMQASGATLDGTI